MAFSCRRRCSRLCIRLPLRYHVRGHLTCIRRCNFPPDAFSGKLFLSPHLRSQVQFYHLRLHRPHPTPRCLEILPLAHDPAARLSEKASLVMCWHVSLFVSPDESISHMFISSLLTCSLRRRLGCSLHTTTTAKTATRTQLSDATARLVLVRYRPTYDRNHAPSAAPVCSRPPLSLPTLMYLAEDDD
ncbi:hypothetical protein B0J12DRAFT_422458 [Macrophomina phaseolina]|uniref:Uncharacterized protein n=1 Tax=Macrophomina phaseolina TaxID=35725 RepID=A0ABQ8GGF1_9PEZI|nr:hypothetical protein B0J12DRAFT_422458 [Macrophomina phaseolina]